MIRKLPLIVLIAFAMSAKAQSIENLDKNNGFKQFKFGLSKSTWDNSIHNVSADTWKYIGDKCKTAFGESVGEVNLDFNNSDKLSSILINLNDVYSFDEQERLCQTIRSAFGDKYERLANENTGDIQCSWIGKESYFVMYSTYVSEGDVRGWVVSLFHEKGSPKRPSGDY